MRSFFKILSEVIELSHAHRQTKKLDGSGGVNRRIFATFHSEYIKNVEYNGTTYWSTHRNKQTNKQTTTLADVTFNNTWELYSCNPC